MFVSDLPGPGSLELRHDLLAAPGLVFVGNEERAAGLEATREGGKQRVVGFHENLRLTFERDVVRVCVLAGYWDCPVGLRAVDW